MLKRAKQVRAEVRSSVEGVEEEIFSLREATRRRAKTDYDAFAEISTSYFRQVVAHLGERPSCCFIGVAKISSALRLFSSSQVGSWRNTMARDIPKDPTMAFFF